MVRALRLRDSRAAEIICLGLAIVGTVVWLGRLTTSDNSSWAVQIAGDSAHVTLAGWWSVICSAPLFYFLLFRGLWRYIVWAMLLWRIASLNLRLVATHPDGKGGLAFLAEYPNAYSMFVFGMSSGFAITVVRHVFEANISSVTFGYIVTAWLAIVFAFFAFPLLAFSKPLAELKDRSAEVLGAQATRYHRAAERALIGRNLAANDSVGSRGACGPRSVGAIRRLAQAVDLSHEPVGDRAARLRGACAVRHRRRDQAALQGSVRAGEKAARSLAACALAHGCESRERAGAGAAMVDDRLRIGLA